MNNEIFVSLVYNTSLLLVLAGLYSGIRFNSSLPPRLKDILTGILAGFIGVAVMANPWKLLPGIVFDVRSILLGVTGLFFGFLPAALAVAITAAFRVVSGGPGTGMGVAVIISSAGLGLLWRRCRPGLPEKGGLLELYLFGVLVHLLMLACTGLLPAAVAPDVLRKIAVPVIVVYPIGTVLLSLLLLRQRENYLTTVKLRESEERYRETMEGAVDGILTGSPQGGITGANSRMQELAGRPLGELAGLYVGALFDPKEIDAVPLRFDLLKKGETLVNQRRLLRPDGTTLAVEMHSKMMPDGTYQSIYRDISERKLAEQAKEKLARDLAEAKHDMENFLYITTHDLRGPLVNIQGFSQNLKQHFGELRALIGTAALPGEARARLDELAGERIPAALDFLAGSGRKMDQLIGSLLKVSRLGRVEMRPEAVDAGAVLKSVLDTLGYQLEAAGGRIKAGDLPSCRADHGALGHIFSNFLSNAIKYRHKNRKLEIEVRGRQSGASVVYTVSDNGTGIAATALPGIWGLFAGGRIPGPEKGEGIGLAMCKMLAEKNGGRVWVESREGEGSDFFLEMPA